MNRFEFFKRLFLGGAAVVAAKYAGAGIPQKETDVYLDSLHIAGFQFYQGTAMEGHLKEDDALSLKRQSDNPHDYFAVEVYRNNKKLGYLPRSDNKLIARMMDQGVNVSAKIRSIDLKAHPYNRVKIRVYAERG
jgi:hypothetical protein